MKRRIFVKNIAHLSTLSLLPGISLNSIGMPVKNKDDISGCLKGFIVSDAHFGWDHKMQPSKSKQIKAMENIRSQFPDLDVFIDTGDAHHNAHHDNVDPLKSKTDWTKIIQGSRGLAPFFYVVGNHEIRSNEDGDPELRANMMGSSGLRPYYSFDAKGIHFISLPELIRAIFLTNEEFDWLQLDLELNKDKSIIILSHNNILGTTDGDEEGYRGLPDSEKLMSIFSEHPNIIAWMHGHNHNYQIVKKNDLMFVSNGRIGGFDPSRGLHGIGGIYFEIWKDKFIVRSYSAEKGIFLDELENELSGELLQTTTYNPSSSFASYYGVGTANLKERFILYNHYCGKNQRREIFISDCEKQIINEDPLFQKYFERNAWHGLDRILMDSKVNLGNEAFEYLNPGLRLKSNSNWWTTLTIPSDNFDRYTYYRCPPGMTYNLSIDILADRTENSEMQKLWLRLLVYNSEGQLLKIVQSDGLEISNGRKKYSIDLYIPELNNHNTVYSDERSEILLSISPQASFSGMKNGDIDVLGFTFSQVDDITLHKNTSILVGNESCEFESKNPDQILTKQMAEPISPKEIVEIASAGTKRLSFIIKHSNLEWQVRNATAAYQGNHIYIGQIRNQYSEDQEVIISPLKNNIEAFVHRIRHAEEIKIFPTVEENRKIKVYIGKLLNAYAVIEVFSLIKLKGIDGGELMDYDGNILSVKVNSSGYVQFNFE